MAETRTVPLKEFEESILGRASTNDPERFEKLFNLFFKDSNISKRHASITFQNHKFYLKDLDSLHGTFLNGILLAPGKLVELNSGDELGLVNLTNKKIGSDDQGIKLVYAISLNVANKSIELSKVNDRDLSSIGREEDEIDEVSTQKEVDGDEISDELTQVMQSDDSDQNSNGINYDSSESDSSANNETDAKVEPSIPVTIKTYRSKNTRASGSSALPFTRRRNSQKQDEFKPFLNYLRKQREYKRSENAQTNFPYSNHPSMTWTDPTGFSRKRKFEEDVADTAPAEKETEELESESGPDQKKQKTIEVTPKAFAAFAVTTAVLSSITTIGILGAIGGYLAE